MLPYLRALLALGFALALAACTTPGAMTSTALNFNETVARSSDSQLLLNIVRAAKRNPTHYTAITQVRDSRNVQGGATVTGLFPFGPGAVLTNSLSPSLTASGTLAPSFDVAPLDTKANAEGLFKPVDEEVFTTFWQHGWPPTVLLFLFVDTVTLNEPAKRLCGLEFPYNSFNNNERNFALATKLFDCIQYRIWPEQTTDKTTYVRGASVAPQAILEALSDLDKGEFKVQETKGLYTISKSKKSWELKLHLGGRPKPVAGAPVSKGKDPAISFTLRSVDSMIYYIGELLRAQLELGHLHTYVFHHRDGRPPEIDTLFAVELNSGADTANYITADFLGNRYSVSRVPSDGDHSLQVLSLISQLFSLFREGKDLPKTSAVQVVGTH